MSRFGVMFGSSARAVYADRRSRMCALAGRFSDRTVAASCLASSDTRIGCLSVTLFVCETRCQFPPALKRCGEWLSGFVLYLSDSYSGWIVVVTFSLLVAAIISELCVKSPSNEFRSRAIGRYGPSLNGRVYSTEYDVNAAGSGRGGWKCLIVFPSCR